MQIPAEPELTSEQRLVLSQGVAEFNRGLYFACHDTLEAVWSALRGPSRDFFQGLIQVSVGFHHLHRGNRAGALKTFARALDRFEPYPARYLGFDLAAERVRLRAVVAALKGDEAAMPQQAPVWRFSDLSAAWHDPERTPAQRPVDSTDS